MINNEQQIITACQAGKIDQFGQLYDGYIRKIYDYIYYKTLHRETAEDLLSQTFIKALKNINTFDASRGNFSAWLYAIARNNVKDHYRAAKNEANIDDLYDLAAADDPALDAENRLVFERVGAYLAKLGPEQREIIVMRLWEGLKHQEIAERLGISEANAKMKFLRAMIKLREELALIIAYLLWLVA